MESNPAEKSVSSKILVLQEIILLSKANSFQLITHLNKLTANQYVGSFQTSSFRKLI